MTTRRQRRLEKKDYDQSEKFHVKIDFDVETNVVREADPDEEWSGEDVEYYTTFNGFALTTEGLGDFVLTKNPSGKTYYLVYALYSDGDSFNQSSGNVSLVSLHENAIDADIVAKAIRMKYTEYEKNHDHDYKPLDVKLTDGTMQSVYTGTWTGYFNRLSEIVVIPLMEGAKRY
jgi:hypothetical protein